jgi:putative transposase
MTSDGFRLGRLVRRSVLRALAVVNVSAHEALAIDVDQGIKSEQVFETTARISSHPRCAPRSSRGQWVGFLLEALDRWAYENGVSLVRLGRKPL